MNLLLHVMCSQDLLHMCRLLNMEDAVDEIIQHLGIVRDGGDGQVRGHISFEDFMRCRLNLGSEIEHERLVLDSSFVHRGMYPVAVDSVSGDIPLQTPDNSDISQGDSHLIVHIKLCQKLLITPGVI